MDMHLCLRISQIERIQLQVHNLLFRPLGLHTTFFLEGGRFIQVCTLRHGILGVLCAVQTPEGFQTRHRFSCR